MGLCILRLSFVVHNVQSRNDLSVIHNLQAFVFWGRQKWDSVVWKSRRWECLKGSSQLRAVRQESGGLAQTLAPSESRWSHSVSAEDPAPVRGFRTSGALPFPALSSVFSSSRPLHHHWNINCSGCWWTFWSLFIWNNDRFAGGYQASLSSVSQPSPLLWHT